jgi:hypothetical protein
MADLSDDLKSQLGKLNPQSRLRVESALKDTLERELAGPGANPAAAFSRGILFSKSGKTISLDEVVLPGLAEMDEAKFKTFMDRIATLKGNKSTGM